ncbi:TIGR01244 family phosphatase [Paraburkholderia sp. LEh10]|jgi:sulfide:quinone oxidoreductase|uniref:beta-lactamase hydrolase domain-containing protein n=1 Tax=Paraburkholderia sp. LEh10 TaxID=2821353 RepID=UPI001AE67735|nr:sulfur transferase domain-containing protein [Paraburkholderia sp. LEh10]MBP0595696.1 TIGR01244 family phosphatase [Paraburkholderia sp. LEh10]
MNPKRITSQLSISPQLTIADVDRLASMGFCSIVVNRPDGEEAGQPTIDEMRRAAVAAGLGFAAIPVVRGKVTQADVDRFGAALEELEGPVIDRVLPDRGTRSDVMGASFSRFTLSRRSTQDHSGCRLRPD